jgi:hypothetical protein
LLRERLAAERLVSGTVLDIERGLGLLSLEFVKMGADRATAVDAAEAFIETGRIEASRQGQAERLSSFMAISSRSPIGCAGNAGRHGPGGLLLSELCATPERRAAAHDCGVCVFIPRDRWFVRTGIGLENALRRIRADPFRAFVHPVIAMQQLVISHGMELLTTRAHRHVVNRGLSPSNKSSLFNPSFITSRCP